MNQELPQIGKIHIFISKSSETILNWYFPNGIAHEFNLKELKL